MPPPERFFRMPPPERFFRMPPPEEGGQRVQNHAHLILPSPSYLRGRGTSSSALPLILEGEGYLFFRPPPHT